MDNADTLEKQRLEDALAATDGSGGISKKRSRILTPMSNFSRYTNKFYLDLDQSWNLSGEKGITFEKNHKLWYTGRLWKVEFKDHKETGSHNDSGIMAIINIESGKNVAHAKVARKIIHTFWVDYAYPTFDKNGDFETYHFFEYLDMHKDMPLYHRIKMLEYKKNN
jgi:hypothetical protein